MSTPSMPAPKTLQHPAFGACELVPTVLAIKWARPLDTQAIHAALSSHSLTMRPAEGTHREPVTWASANGVASDILADILAHMQTDPDIEWVAPVYRPLQAGRGPASYFAVNPSVLLLSRDAASIIANLTSIDESITIDHDKSTQVREFFVLSLPKRNAVELAGRINELGAAQGIANAVRFENLPCLSPV